MDKLKQKFYLQDAVVVAKELIGKILVVKSDAKYLLFLITETEAYGGKDDDASHAYKGKTTRNEAMFAAGGVLYVYQIYGLHHCLNIVCGEKGDGQAVLIRSLKLLNNFDYLSIKYYHKKYQYLTKTEKNNFCHGPGRICKVLNIDKGNNYQSLLNSNLFIIDYPKSSKMISEAKPRINIDYAVKSKNFLYRFQLSESVKIF